MHWNCLPCMVIDIEQHLPRASHHAEASKLQASSFKLKLTLCTPANIGVGVEANIGTRAPKARRPCASHVIARLLAQAEGGV